MANNDNKFKIQTTANNVFMQSDDTSIEENVVSLKKNKTDILDSAFNQNLMSTAITNKNKLLYGKVADLSIHTGIVETDEEKYWEAYFNINKTLTNLTEFDILFFQIKYCYNNEYYTTYINSNYSLLDNKFINKYIYAASDRDLPLLNNLNINSKYELDEENNISKIENNEYCCFTIVCSDTLMVGTLTEDDIEILNNMEISLYIGKQNVLLNNNTAEYTPTENYHPATKKYVDESINAIKDYIVLKDQVNGYNYTIAMRDGSLTSSILPVSIEVVTAPTKTSYIEGELLDTTDLVVAAINPDRTKIIINNEKLVLEPISSNSTKATIKYIESGMIYSTTVDITVTAFDPAIVLVDFEYTVNEDGTYTLTAWKETLNGEPSTEMVIPDNTLVIL